MHRYIHVVVCNCWDVLLARPRAHQHCELWLQTQQELFRGCVASYRTIVVNVYRITVCRTFVDTRILIWHGAGDILCFLHSRHINIKQYEARVGMNSS